jgi:phosphatidylethanolamine/phosphatidyl-N-methylethanolamine N-methyltransferase
MQALEQFEKRIKLFEQMIGKNIEKRVKLIEQTFEEKVEQPFRRIERKIGKNIERRVRLIEEHFEQKVELPFRRTGQKIGRNIETQIRKPLARAMAQYVDPHGDGPVIELGPGTGPITEALVEHGVKPSRLVLVEFNPVFCQLLRERFPEATVIQADAYRLREALAEYTRHGVSAIVSGLPLMTKPLLTRMRLLREALALLAPQAPFVQFTYAVVPPIPKLAGVKVEASERIWRNMPPARVWVYRHS